MAPLLTIDRASAVENGFITFTIRLSAAAAQSVTADYALVDGTADVGDVAEPGNDVFASSDPLAGKLTFAPGEVVKQLTFSLHDDALDEFDEHFAVQLSNPVGASFDRGQTIIEGTGWVLDDDGAGNNRTAAITNVEVEERPGAEAVFDVSLSRPSAGTITLRYQTVADSADASDFVAQTGTITFAAGETDAQVAIAIRTDTKTPETDETFHLQLLPPFGALAPGAVISQGTATIVDYVLLGTTGSDRIIGPATPERIDALEGNDTVIGGAGNDVILGRSGNDQLDGRGGNDIMVGGSDNDVYIVDSTGDRIDEKSGAAGGLDTVLSTSANVTLAANVERMYLAGSADLRGTGNDLANIMGGSAGDNTLSGLGGNDVIKGNAGNDVLLGGDGNDGLDGGLGADYMRGGKGNDAYFVDQTTDKAVELATDDGIDLVYSSATFTLSANVEKLVLFGGATINGIGNSSANVLSGNLAANVLLGLVGDDVLKGNTGNDQLFGGAGNDTLYGGLGDDELNGGGGNDLFVYQAGRDHVAQFENDVDSLLIAGSLLGGGARTAAHALEFATLHGTDAVFNFGGGNTLTVSGVAHLSDLSDDIFLF